MSALWSTGQDAGADCDVAWPIVWIDGRVLDGSKAGAIVTREIPGRLFTTFRTVASRLKLLQLVLHRFALKPQTLHGTIHLIATTIGFLLGHSRYSGPPERGIRRLSSSNGSQTRFRHLSRTHIFYGRSYRHPIFGSRQRSTHFARSLPPPEDPRHVYDRPAYILIHKVNEVD